MNLQNYYMEEFRSAVGIYKNSTIGHHQPFFHWHPYYEILVIMSGEYTVTSNTVCVRDRRPCVIIHSPFCLHRIDAEATCVYTRYIINAQKSLLARLPADICDLSVLTDSGMLRLDPSPTELLRLESLCEQLRPLANTHHAELCDMPNAVLFTALILNQLGKIRADNRCEAYLSQYSYIEEVLRTVTDDFSRRLTVEELCSRFGVGRTKFTQDFRAATGKSFKRYITDLRQTHALELLAMGMSIVEVSLEVGYSSEAHFIKAFREYHGMTPGQLQQQRLLSDGYRESETLRAD